MEVTKQSKDFDATLEGEEKLPLYINIMKAAQSRAKEVTKTLNMLTSNKGTKLAFQLLPKHMRRRTMSHNVKRLPQKLRAIHFNQLQKSGMPVKTKRPSRKWRRKPTNLLKAYVNRQRKTTWLETHIWHAKRFHMIEKWGYKLPLQSHDKTFRACYRASAKYCLLQDVSYYCNMMLYGDQNVLLEGFKLMTDPSTGLTVGSKAFLNSRREGTCVFYNVGKFPFGAIGEVTFIWKPSVDSDRVIWLWAHPSFFNEFVENILHVFNLLKMHSDFKKYQYYNVDTRIGLNILKGHFNRFKLTGKLANKVLHNALVIPTSKNKTEWFNEYLNEDDNRQIFFDQCQYWNSIKNIDSVAELSPHIVVNLINTDPRYNFPSKRKKLQLNDTDEDIEEILDICPSLKYGEIWKYEVRKAASKNKITTSQFLKSRDNLVVPEEVVPDEACAIPILLMQQPGVKDSSNLLGYGSGWDVIIPSNWGLPFWLCFIMWGAKPGGIRESESIQYEMGRCNILLPDTAAGETEEQNIYQEYKNKYFRLPPAKRINYNKIGISCPFSFPWKKIIEEWSSTSNKVEEFYVLRDKNILNKLQENINNKNVKFLNVLNLDIKLYENCLIPVQLQLVRKGCARKFAIICLPEERDLIIKEKKVTQEPIEDKHTDVNKKIRIKLRKEHKQQLKRLRHQRVKAKKEGKEVLKPQKQPNDEYLEEMKNLWLPNSKQVSDSCSRKIMGFVTKGENSMVSGSGRSVGFIALGAMKFLMQNDKINMVLVRNNNTRKYRFAKIKIIC